MGMFKSQDTRRGLESRS